MSLNQCSRYAVMEDLQVLIAAEEVEKPSEERNILKEISKIVKD